MLKNLIQAAFVSLIFCSQLLPAGSAFELLLTLDTGLPPSGRNGSMLGEEVAVLGDVNGDGYDDWAIGLPWAARYEAGESVGKVYIYFGAAHIPDEKDPDIILIGENAGDQFGGDISAAGDVNGDGFADVLVCAPYYGLASRTARIYIYYGGSPMDDLPDVIYGGDGSNSAHYPWLSTRPDRIDMVQGDIGPSSVNTISGTGDLNGDGYDDIVFGTGRQVLIFFGNSEMDLQPDLILNAETERDGFGYSVAGAGDVNGDGFDDLIVGAYGYDFPGYNAGRAYLYFGGTQMDSIPDVIFDAENAGDQFGKALSPAGDLNRDGYNDIIIGAPFSDALGEETGRAYIYCGADSMDAEADAILEHGQSYNDFGAYLHCAGDLNGDGNGDLLIGSNENLFDSKHITVCQENELFHSGLFYKHKRRNQSVLPPGFRRSNCSQFHWLELHRENLLDKQALPRLAECARLQFDEIESRGLPGRVPVERMHASRIATVENLRHKASAGVIHR